MTKNTIYDFTVSDNKGNEVKLDQYKADNDIRWNFTKFLVDREGHVITRFEPTATKEVLTPAIEELL